MVFLGLVVISFADVRLLGPTKVIILNQIDLFSEICGSLELRVIGEWALVHRTGRKTKSLLLFVRRGKSHTWQQVVLSLLFEIVKMFFAFVDLMIDVSCRLSLRSSNKIVVKVV